MHAELREAGPVVHLSRYDIHALARYDEVYAALVDWQGFQSAAGVGLSNFRYEKPWRPPSLLLEADPPKHDAPRRVLQKVLGPRALRRLRDGWAADAEALVDEVLARGTELRRRRVAGRGLPAARLPRRRRHPAARAGRTCSPTATTPSTPSGRATTWSPRARRASAELSAWVNAQCQRDVLAADRVRRGHLGGVRPRRHHAGAGAARRPLAADGRRRHDGARALRRPLRLRHPPRASGSGCGRTRRWRASRSTRRCAGSRRCRPSSGRRPPTSASADVVIPEGHKILMFLAAANRDPRRWDDPDAFDLSRDPSGHVGFGMGIHQCVGQHVARLEAETLVTALARRVATIELDGPTVRHHNNTLRAWESIPVRVTLD